MRAIVFAAALLGAGPTVAQTANVAPVVAAERAFAADAPSMGIAGSFNKWSVPEAILIAGGRVQRIGAVYPDGPRPADEPLLEWWPNFAGVARSGELGFTTGGVAVGGRRAGHYFTIWRKQSDGGWRWVYDGGSGASAADVPGPDSEPVILALSDAPRMAPQAAFAEVGLAEQEFISIAARSQKDAHLRFLAPDARLYVAPLPPATDPQAHAAALDGWPEAFTMDAPEGGGASDWGDLVWTYGPVMWAAGEQQRRGHYVHLWQRRSEGWRMVLAQLIPAPQTAAPAPSGG